MARKSCPLEVKGGPSNKYGKISILIQAFISRSPIDSFSLVSDAAYISASLARIMRALFEICLRRGWCEMTSFMLDYCKAVDRQIWPHQHPLRQFDKDISLEKLRKLEEREADLDRLQDLPEKDIGVLIQYAPGGKLVKQYLAYFPWIQLSATVSPITRTVLKVDLVVSPEFIWKDRFHGAAQRWWILGEGSWSDKDSALWMLPCMTADLSGSLSKNGISNVHQLQVIPRSSLHSLIGNFPVHKLNQDLQRFPRVQLKDEAWWLVLCNTSTSELYAMKRVSFADRLVTRMELPPTSTTLRGVKLMVVSDCYIGVELEYPVDELV
ncbi:hypothetical protein QQ045_010185 [Rhodiola kirilowii]